MPAGERLPGAEVADGVGVVEAVERHLAAAPARVTLGVRLALGALAVGAFPRRFAGLEPEAARRVLEGAAGSRVRARRDLAALLKSLVSVAYAGDPAVTAALGAEGRCARAGAVAASAPRPATSRLDRGALVPAAEVERCDVVVVGSGAGGAAAARVLAEAGLDVIVVEEGDHHDASTYPSDPLEGLRALYRDGGLTFCEGRPPIPLPLGRCVGGTTVVNSGTCLRPADGVLARWRDERGIAWAPDLAGDLEALERDLDVRPVDPDRAGRNAALCRAGAEALGASNRPLPRNAGDVVCCGTCPTGCRLDAKQAMHVSELPRAVAAGARVRAGVRVEKVLVRTGCAVGVAGVLDGPRREPGGREDPAGALRPYAVEARAVVMAAGAVGTPALLARQRLADRSGALGRHLRIHPACWVGGVFDEEVRGWDGVMQSWLVDEWHDRGLFLEATFTPVAFGAHWLPGTGARFVERLEAYDRLAVIGVHLSERSSSGRVRAAPGGARIRYSLSGDDAARLRFGIARAADLLFAVGATAVHPQIAGVESLAPGEQRRIEDGRFRPADLRLEAFHPMGTARMGADPATSVVGPTGECHDVPGLWVADASGLPTSPEVNPMLTIMAVARRVGRAVAERLGA